MGREQGFSVNQAVRPLVERLIDHSREYRIDVRTLSCGTVVIDVGLAVSGSYEASRLNAQIMTGGTGELSYGSWDLVGPQLPCIDISISDIELGCIASQIAGLKIPIGSGLGIGSGPGRALAAAEDDHCIGYTSYRDRSDYAVLTIQTEVPSDEQAALWCAKACGVDPRQLVLIEHSTCSHAASVQVSARIIEQSINRMLVTGFDTSVISEAWGRCILAPVADDELKAFGRINDCLLYGGFSLFTVDCEDSLIEEKISGLVTSDCADYGTLFGELYERAGRSFYAMDNAIHSPAVVQITNRRTGRFFSAGTLRADLLERSLLS